MKEKLRAYYIDLVQGRRRGALDAPFCFFLNLISFIYGFSVRLILLCYRIRLFKAYKPDCKVISIGNITWGGTGKTPLVVTLTEFFKKEGKRPAILIRGYGEDEVYMLKNKFKDVPVLAGRDRIKTAKDALRYYRVDTIILDDGFQHWGLDRDMDIVLIDSQCPFGNRKLIPAGILREPLSSLSRANVFVITGTEFTGQGQNLEALKEELKRYNPEAQIYEAVHSPASLYSLSSGEEIKPYIIRAQPIAFICGIGNPERFARTVDLLGAEVLLSFCFGDHYQYNEEDLKRIERDCLERQIRFVITTEKDAIKLKPLLKPERLKIEILVLEIELKIARGQDRFFSLLKEDRDKIYSVLILNDGKAGHLNQAKAVAKIVRRQKMGEGKKDDEVNIRIVEVKYKGSFFRNLLSICSVFAGQACRGCLSCLRFCLKRDSFKELIKYSCDIIISCGSSLSAVNLFLSYKNNARSIILMKPPFISLNRFDLAIVPEHDRVKLRDNVLLTKIAPNPVDSGYLQEQAAILIDRLSSQDPKFKTDMPTIGVFIGGDTHHYRMTGELIKKIVFQLKQVAENFNCQILVSTSRRTSKDVENLLKESLADFYRCRLLIIANEKNIPEAVGGILGLSHIIIVSGESISMVSEAVSAEGYVLVFIPEKKVRFLTKQDRFLKSLEKEEIIRIIQPDNLFSEVERVLRERPYRNRIDEQELIYQAISRIFAKDSPGKSGL